MWHQIYLTNRMKFYTAKATFCYKIWASIIRKESSLERNLKIHTENTHEYLIPFSQTIFYICIINFSRWFWRRCWYLRISTDRNILAFGTCNTAIFPVCLFQGNTYMKFGNSKFWNENYGIIWYKLFQLAIN